MNTTKNKIKFSYMLALLILLAGLQACTETWDSYYDQKSKTGDDLFTTIKATPDLKIFTRILEKSGYNNILSQSKSFTVFAPVDSVLESLDIETMDSISLAKIVENHVACSSVGTPSEGTLRVNMLNSKYVLFEKTGKKFYFGSFELASYDQLCANGILHKLAGEVPFAANMYQAMANDTSISTVYQYFKSYELKTYDLSKSVYVGVNSKGQKVYDTLWVTTNYKLNKVGRIDLEDSVYTAIIPTNSAYSQAFNAYRPYFITYNSSTKLENKDSTNYLTKNAVMNDLIFRGLYRSVAEMPDTMKSTLGAKIPTDSLRLTEAGVLKDIKNVSNGYLYVVNQLYEPAMFKFFKDVSVEAEASLTRTAGSTTSAYNRSVNTDIFTQEVSGSRFLYLETNTTSDEATVTFSCANVLSGAYDIYCVVVPAAAESKTDSTRLSFTLTARDAASKLVQKKYPSASTADYGAANYLTSPNNVKEILVVKGFKFPFSNTTDLTLKVSTSVAASETAILSRKVRIDRILFKPAQK